MRSWSQFLATASLPRGLFKKRSWIAPAGLILLSIIPALAGTVRLIELTQGMKLTEENARFVAAPLPVTLHIVSSTIFSLVGAFQFSTELRSLAPAWHRFAGKVLIACGLVSALSGLWMTQFYPRGVNPPTSFDGPYLYAIRLAVGSAMSLCICFGLAAIRRLDIQKHRAWMMRAYALGLGAGTQVFTHIPWFLFPCIHGELARTLCMGAGWAVNLAVAEWVVSRQPLRTR